MGRLLVRIKSNIISFMAGLVTGAVIIFQILK